MAARLPQPAPRSAIATPLGAILTLVLALAGCATAAQRRTETASGTATVSTDRAGVPAELAPAPAGASASKPLAGPPEWRDAVLYFVLIDRFADGDPGNDPRVDREAKGTFHGGDLRGLTAHLDEIAGLGVTALWINPVVENIPGFVTGAGFPDWGYHGYWADDFTRVDRRFGTEDDLRALVDAAHRRGIRVLLDVVYNHVGYDSRYLSDPRTRGWLRNPAGGTCGQDDLTTCLAGLPDFRTEDPSIWPFLLDAPLGLAARTGFDGFRLDTVKHVDHPFWKEHRAQTRGRLGREFFLVGEVWGGDAQSLDPWFVDDEMDAGFDFGFQGSALAWLQGRGRTVAFDRYLKSRETVRPGHFLAHFLSSHDVPGALFQLDGDVERFRLAVVLQMTASGIPTVYYGEEVARRGGDWPDNRSDMPWGDRPIEPGRGDPRDEGLRAFYTKVIGLRRAHPALSRGVHTGLATEGDLLVFLREDAASGDAVVVAVNRGDAAAAAAFAVPAAWGPRSPAELLADASLQVRDGRVELPVPARSARIVGLR